MPASPPTPSHLRALAQYREHARSYDRSLSVIIVRPVYRAALTQLALQPGETVLDVACGTGLNFAGIRRAIGPQGRLIGIEQSPEMLDVARKRVASHAWRNIELIESAAEQADLPSDADAALFSFAHDVLRTPAAIGRIAAALRPGGRVVAAGIMDPSRPRLGTLARRASCPYVTTFDGFALPWSMLAREVRIVRVERPSGYLGSMYVVTATKVEACGSPAAR